MPVLIQWYFQVVLSNKGGPKVIHQGFMYTLHKKQPNNIRWRCVGRTLHCRGSLITTSNCKKPRIRMQHNHSPDFAAAQLARKRYIALGKPPVLPGRFTHQSDCIDMNNGFVSDDEPRTRTTKSRNSKHSDFMTWADWPVQNQPQWQRQLLPILPKGELHQGSMSSNYIVRLEIKLTLYEFWDFNQRVYL